MTGMIKRVVAERLTGERPSVGRALLVAVIVGLAAAVITYILLRSKRWTS